MIFNYGVYLIVFARFCLVIQSCSLSPIEVITKGGGAKRQGEDPPTCAEKE